MKNLKQFINESFVDKAIDELATLFKNVLLKDVELTEDDFEELDDNTFNLCNVPQDSKLADEFIKGISKINASVKTKNSEEVKEISLKQSGKDDAFIRINLDTESGEGYKKGDILSIDMSKEIKDKLLQK